MTVAQGKKLIIKELIAKGDKRSYNEIAADLELDRWTRRHKGDAWAASRPSKIKVIR